METVMFNPSLEYCVIKGPEAVKVPFVGLVYVILPASSIVPLMPAQVAGPDAVNGTLMNC